MRKKRMSRALTLIASFVLLLSTTASLAQQPAPAQPEKLQAKGDAATKKAAPAQEAAAEKVKPKSSTDEDPVITHHRVTVDGKELKYTATAGLMPIKDAKGETEAHIFFIAYTLDDPPHAASRPVMFSFNGGPGSASVWLHIGALGPRRVTVTEEPVIPPPPFRLVDNEATWLDRTDLVFIDPVGTGYSRAAKPELSAKFHAVRGDITSVGEFIRMYVTRNDRWASPLYLIGESYGTTRAAGLAGYLVDQGVAFNGLFLVSCALDFQGFMFGGANDAPYRNYLSAYAASAWYHKKLPADLQALDLATLLKEVEQWSDKEYASILARGDELSVDERNDAVSRLTRYTGLKSGDIEATHLRITQPYFCKKLLESGRRSIGRFDARYQGVENTPAGDAPSFDPSLAGVRATYTSTFNNYVRTELGFKTDAPYHILGEGIGPWNWQTQMGYPTTTEDLKDAMTKNPHMMVLIASGYYDLATPYRAVENTLASLALDPSLRKNITIAKYESGHMMYVHGPSLHKLKRDGAALIDRTAKK
jgi:carboxypeptidase C (cathepsin A)